MGRSAVVFALLLGACYRPDLGRCEVTCADGTTCPSGWQCNAGDHYCHTPDDTDVCQPADIDAAPVPPSGYTALAAGGAHACAIDDQQHLWCWGRAANGQLGIGEGAQRTGTPTQVAGEGWTQVAGGDLHTCAIQSGAMRCWGRNDSGQAGDASLTGTPQPVGTDTDWIAVAAGGAFSCGIRGTAGAGGRAYCWGYDFDGELGDGGMLGGSTPIQVGTTDGVDRFDDFVAISARDAHTCALRAGGDVYCWGIGSDGQLGSGDGMGHTYPVRAQGGPFDAIASGGNFTCALAASDHGLWCWGDNSVGQLATTPGTPLTANAPRDAQAGTGWSALSAGDETACAVKDGQEYCWGHDDLGEIGDATWTDTHAPTPVASLASVTATATGYEYSCAITGGDAYCWGVDDDGQLGNGKVAMKDVPTRAGTASDWQAISVGHNHACGLRAGGHLWCWGWNLFDELGATGAGVQSPVPVEVTASDSWDAVVVGEAHTCALRNNGTNDDLWCWGANYDHQIGNGQSSSGVFAPAQIDHQSAGWTLLTASTNGNCAVTGGARYCWGGNFQGVLGNGNNNETDTPTMVTGDPGTWTGLSLADAFGCGIAGGNLYCWGDDSYGEQGRGSSNDGPFLSPTQTATGYDKVSVAWAGTTACGLASGAMSCWGNGGYGILGNTDPGNDKHSPTPVQTQVASWDQVSVGYYNVCAIATGGDLYCWGRNIEDELGDPSLAYEADTPQHIGTDSWKAISTSYGHSCAIDTGGALYCWGDNAHGTIGDGSQAEPLPVRTAR